MSGKDARWFTESCTAGYQLRLRMDAVVKDHDDGGQHVQIFDTPELGRVLAIDGTIQVATGDEFIYHEMMAHTPLFAHGAVKQALIIGGGDGGVLREVLRHPGVERVVLAELDPLVIDISLSQLPDVHAGAFDDPRSETVISDGAEYVRRTTDFFDVIIVDSTDPAGPGKVLFSPEFYAACHARLRPDGVFICQAGTPLIDAGALRLAYGGLSKNFNDASAFIISTACYTGGPMALLWASDDPAKKSVSQETLTQRFDLLGLETRCYTPETHRAAFALPPYIAEHLQ